MKSKPDNSCLNRNLFFYAGSFSLLMILCISFVTGCRKNDRPSLAGPVNSSVANDDNAAMRTSGFSGDGVNLQPSYYNNGNPNMAWSLMKQQTKIKTVRIEIEPDKVQQAKTWIADAKANGFAVVATYHKASVLGSDATSELTAAANWWKTNYNTLGGGFIVNLMNEWGSHNISSNSFASAYNSAISTVRQVYSGQIIIDIPGWGQETRTAADAVKGTNGTKINDANIILSTHIYPGSWNQGRNRFLTNADLDEMASAGKPCIVGEFGNSGGSGADWSGLVDYARNKGWTLLAWAWNGDGGSMNMVSPSWASNGGATSFTLSSYFNVVYAKLSGDGTMPPPSGSIVIRARGTNGSEQIQLRINGNTVATWTVSTSMNNYTYNNYSSGTIQLYFTNDASNRDVQVDYAQIGGTTVQAESRSINTAFYANGRCGGGGNSEWMNCNGYIQFN